MSHRPVPSDEAHSGPRLLDIALLDGDTRNPACHDLPERFFLKFTEPTKRHPDTGAYERGCSILIAPATFEEYWSAPSSYWLRQRVRRARKEGYEFGSIDRNQYLDDIYAINTSLEARQGRPMSEAYHARPSPSTSLPADGCVHHRLLYYGITRDAHLWAYAWVYQVGEMCLFSTILGHGEHMKAGIMPLLVARTVEDLMQTADLRYAMYNLHDSGTDGLRFFKEQMGFRRYDVRWHLATLDGSTSPSGQAVESTASTSAGAPGTTGVMPAGAAPRQDVGLASRLRRFVRRAS